MKRARLVGPMIVAFVAAVVLPALAGTSVPMEVPILYNDRHVYASPDTLRNDRALAAIVKDGVVLIPLRSMFERMGATVTFDSATKTMVARRGETEISVTLGVAAVMINGESRPLDTAPMMYKSAFIVPVRVISEGLGAYVEWLPTRRIVVIRYLPPTPPTPPPTPVPSPMQIPAPTAAPIHAYIGYVQGALTMWGKDYNEFHNGPYCRNGSFVGAVVYRPTGALALKVDTRQDRYVTTTGFTDSRGNQFTVFGTIDGGVAKVPVFMAQQNTIDARLEYRVAEPNVYAGVGYIRSGTNYGYPRLGGIGFGAEKLPDFTATLSLYASAFYYPTAEGNYTVDNPSSNNFNVTYKQQYGILIYDIGAAWQFSAGAPVYAYGGFAGDRFTVKANAPIGQTHSGLYLGLGFRY
jgi:hypothetical protein